MRYCLLLIYILSFPPLFSQSPVPVVLENNLQIYPLDEYLELYIDTSGQFDLEDIRNHYLKEFTRLDTTLKSGNPGWSYWLHFQVVTPAAIGDHILVMKNPRQPPDPYWPEYYAGNRWAEVHYLYKNGSAQSFRTGTYLPASQKIYRDQPLLNAFPFPGVVSDTIDVFVQTVNVDRDWVHLSLELRSPEIGFPNQTEAFSSLIYFMIGAGMTLGVLALFFYLAVRDRANLYFAASCLFIVLHALILVPDLPFLKIFIPEHPWLLEYFWFAFTHGSFILFILFGRELLDLKRRSPRRDRIFLFIAGGFTLNILFHFAIQYFGLPIRMTLMPILTLAFLIASIEVGFLKDLLSRIFAIGSGWLMFFSILGLLNNQNIFTLFNPWPIGFIGILVVYGLGLAIRIQMMEREKQQAARIVELDGLKSRFFANISHEFRTPLTLIISPVQKMLEQMPASDEQNGQFEKGEILVPVRHLQMVKRNAFRLQQLINQLLDLSRLENASMKLSVRQGDVIKFLRFLVFSFESLAERKKIHFQTRFAGGGHLVFFDQEALEKIMLNLLANAFKFTPEKGRVSVDVFQDQRLLKVAVGDSGPGIPKEDLDKIFERFFRSHNTEEQGTGIGLNLVKELVELHHGQISVESSVGDGTVFRFSIPVHSEAYAKEELTEDAKAPTTTLLENFITDEDNGDYPVDMSDGEITFPLALVVEDNPDLRNYIGEILQTDFKVITAADGQTGLSMAIDNTPDLVISDIMMPGLDGISLCRKIKATPSTSHIPVILLTAKAGKKDELGGLEGGADHYLTKPFDARELKIRLQNLIEQRERVRRHLTRDENAALFTPQVHLKPSEVTVTSVDQKFLESLTSTIEENMDNEFFSVEDLASALNFSRSQLFRKLKALTGKGPNEIIRDFRLSRAKELLEKGHGNVSEVAISVGYGSLSYFTRSFKQAYGKLPSEI